MRNYQNMVFSTAMRLLANHAEAEDMAQEVFLRAYERFGELSASPTAGGWLKTVATNLSLNHLSRYRSRWSFFSEMFHGGGEDDEREMEFPVEGDSHEELAAALVAVIRDPRAAARRRDHARHAVESLSIERCVDSYRLLYEKLLARAS